jgi:hypothetical protein
MPLSAAIPEEFFDCFYFIDRPKRSQGKRIRTFGRFWCARSASAAVQNRAQEPRVCREEC